MKKIIGIALAISLIFCNIFSSVNIASAADKKLEAMEMLNLMNKLGVINSEYDSENDYVSRENFALYTARLLKLDNESVSDIRYFRDVEQDSYAAAAINALAQHGYILGGDGGNFNPKDIITAGEAYTVLIRIMGYETYALKFPEGVRAISMAKELKICSDTNASKQLSVADTALILGRAMQTGYYLPKGGSVNEIDYEYDEDTTILSTYWGAYSAEGTVTAVYGGSLEGHSTDSEGRIELDGKAYTISGISEVQKYLGSYVKLFHYAQSSDENGEIFFIGEYPGKVETITFDIEELEELSNSKITWYTDTASYKTSSKNLSNCIIVYNGMPLVSDIKTKIENLNKGTITVKDRDNDSEYDTVLIEDYKTCFIGGIDPESKVIYDKINPQNSYSLQDYDAVKIHAADGSDVKFEDLGKNMLLSVKEAEYMNSAVIDITVNQNSFTGILNGKSFDTNGNNTAVIGSKEYEVDNACAIRTNESLNLGTSYTYYIDLFNEIAYIDEADISGMRFGYILGRSYDKSEIEVEETVYLKILTDEGNGENISTSKKVSLDGKMYNNKPVDFITKLAQGNGEMADGVIRINSQMIRYSLDDEGKINKIDSLVMSDEEDRTNSITSIYNGTDKKRWFNINRLGVKAVLGKNTKVFAVPESTLIDADKCKVGSYNEFFTSDKLYYTDAYHQDGHGYADAVLYVYQESDISGASFDVLSKRISMGVNDDNEEVYILECLNRGIPVKYEVPVSVNLGDIEPGDILQVNANINGEVSESEAVKKVFDCGDLTPINWANITEEHTRFATSTTESYRATPQLSMGYVTSVRDGVVSWSNILGGDDVESAYIGSLPVIVYDGDKREDKVSIGSVDSIVDYESAGDNCSLIVFQTAGASQKCAIIFN